MKRIYFGLVFMGAMAMTVATYAQTPPPIAPIVAVTRVIVAPGRVAEWMEIEKLYTEAHKKGGGQWRRVYRSNSGRGNEFMVMTPLSSYADLDGQSPTAKGATDVERARWAARRAQCTESTLTSYESLLPGAYINESGGTTPKMVIVNRYRIKAGTGDAYAEFVKNDQIPMLKKAGVKLFVVRRTDYGGSRWSYVTRRGIDKFADLDVNLTEKTLGKDGAAKYFAKSANFLTDVTIDIYTYMADISYIKE